MIDRLLKSMMPRPGKNGGLKVPDDKVKAAKSANLIVLPSGVVGKNCSTCEYMDETRGVCSHEKLYGTPVNHRMACIFWFNPKSVEAWDEPEKKK